MKQHFLTKSFLKFPLLLLYKSNLLSAVSCRMVQLTHKHKESIHPKHLVQIRPVWYMKYIKPSDCVLDIGCNNAQHTLRVAAIAKYVIGIDCNPKTLKIAERELKRLNARNVILQQINIEKSLPYPAAKFSTVLFLDVLEHLVQREPALKEIYRVLKPNGYLLLSVPNSATKWKRLLRSVGINFYSDPDHKVEFTKTEIQDVLRKAKFKIYSIAPVTLDTPLVGLIDLMGGLSLSLYCCLAKWRRSMAIKYPYESIGFEIVCQK